MEKPMLCVLFITYNHKNYVADALDSILMQKTNFAFSIVAGDDCSKDGTREIVKDYAARHPGRFVITNPENNLGAEKNFNQILGKCIAMQPKYIAYLEGDDFWMDEDRLQKQVDLLENEPAVAMVYGKYKMINNRNEYISVQTPPYQSGHIFNDLITCKFLPALHASVYRTKILAELFSRSNFIGSDFFIVAEAAMHHEIKFLDEFYFVYRQTSGSVTKTQANVVTSQFVDILNLYKDRYPELVQEGLKVGGRRLLYNQAEDNPSLKNLFNLLKRYEFTFLHQKQIVKWFFLNLKNLTGVKAGNS